LDVVIVPPGAFLDRANPTIARAGNSVEITGDMSWEQEGWRMSTPKLTIIGGCGSSGTTLLVHILSKHPSLCSGPEFNCFNHYELFDFPLFQRKFKEMLADRCSPNGYVDVYTFLSERAYYGISFDAVDRWVSRSDDCASFIKQLCGHLADRFESERVLEKTPTNVYGFRDILRTLPDVKIIHVVRDGRDVVTSLMRRGWNLFGAGSRWLYDTLCGLSVRGHKNYLEIRYEDFVTDTGTTLKQVLDHIELPFDDSILHGSETIGPGVYSEDWETHATTRVWTRRPSDPVSPAPVGRYKNELEKDDLSLLYRFQLTGPAARTLGAKVRAFPELLQLLGYDLDDRMGDWEKNPRIRLKGIQYEVGDYYRRAKRFLRKRNLEIPKRYTTLGFQLLLVVLHL
jgi:hypothetical protein